MVRQLAVVYQTPSACVGQDSAQQDDQERVDTPNLAQEHADDECADGDGGVDFHGILQTQDDLNGGKSTTEKDKPIATQEIPLMSLWIPGLSR